MPKIVKITSNLLKLHIKNCRLFFSGHAVLLRGNKTLWVSKNCKWKFLLWFEDAMLSICTIIIMILYLSLICISYEYSCLFKNTCTTGINYQRSAKTTFYLIMKYIVIILAQHLISTYLELIPVMATDLFHTRQWSPCLQAIWKV